MGKKLFSASTLYAGLVACLATSATAAGADAVDVFFRADGKLRVVQRDVQAGQTPVQAAVAALIAGPTAEEQAAGVFSAIPQGVRLNSLDVSSESVTIDFSDELLSVEVSEVFVEAVHVQASWTLRQFGLDRSVKLTVGGQPLSGYLPPVIKPAPSQAKTQGQYALDSLSGHSVTISPGHGYFWNGSGWYTQRPVYCSPLNQEDFHNLEMCQYLQTYLAADGVTVRMVRCTNKSQGNHGSGHPWWQMAAYTWLQNVGYPCSVYANSSGDCNLGSGSSESSDDIRSRPLASDYDSSDIYVSLHTNGYTGDCTGSCPTGTETYYDASTEHAAWGAVSQTLATNINSAIMNAITANVDSSWTCHGTCVKNSNGDYGEIRIPDRAATLTELGFHDTCDRDADGSHLRENFFRSAAMWGMYKGICDYFGTSPTWAFYSDEYVSDTIPTTMQPSQSYNVSVTFRNRGVLWTESRAIRLGAVGDSDPFTAFNRVNISGEVGPGNTYTFSFTMTAPATSGTYTTDWRMVRDGVTWFGATCSKQVQVGGGGPQPPSIIQHPSNQTVPVGGIATFTVQAAGDAPLYYQWQKDTVDLSDGGKVSGANTTTLQIVNVDASDQGPYRCVVTNAHGSATSNAATLTITVGVFMVESRSGGQNYAKYSETGTWGISGGKSTAEGVTAGIGSRYGSTYRSVAGEKHAIFSADLPVAGTYEVSVTWGANSNRRNPILHRITHGGGSTDVNLDQSATANRWISLGFYAFSAGSNVGNVDVNNLNIDLSGSMYADAVKWVYVSPPAIIQHPAAQSVCPGTTATFTIAASGGGTLSYQWQRNGTNLSNGGHYSGVTTTMLTVSSSDGADAANYRCVVTNTAGSVTSNQAALALKTATGITQHPQSQTVCPGPATSVQFSVVATGDGTVSYQWQKNGVNLTEGGHYSDVTSSTLTVLAVDSTDAGTYRCLVTAGCGTLTSNEAVLTLKATAAADFDHDCDVDHADYDVFAACSSGPGVPYGPGCSTEDLDIDEDVDQVDFGLFQRCHSGEDVAPDPNCAN